MSKASERYTQLQTGRTQFLDVAVEASELTLPYLVTQDDNYRGKRTLLQPFQSVGAKAVVTLAAKLMLAMLPPQTAFFKLQVDDGALDDDPQFTPEVRSELDLSLSKIERNIMDVIAQRHLRRYSHRPKRYIF